MICRVCLFFLQVLNAKEVWLLCDTYTWGILAWPMDRRTASAEKKKHCLVVVTIDCLFVLQKSKRLRNIHSLQSRWFAFPLDLFNWHWKMRFSKAIAYTTHKGNSNFSITIVKIYNNLQSFCSFHCYHITWNVDVLLSSSSLFFYLSFNRINMVIACTPRTQRQARAFQNLQQLDVWQGKKITYIFILSASICSFSLSLSPARDIRNVNRNGQSGILYSQYKYVFDLRACMRL